MRRTGLFVLLIVILLGTKSAPAKEWFRGLDLESGVARADLILVARVAQVSEVKTVYGGKAERVMQQFTFTPVRTLKGIFAREALQLTSDDLGMGRFDADPADFARGQIRLLILGRSGLGYANGNPAGSLDASIPPLRDETDPLLAAVRVLIAVTQHHDREDKVVLLRDGLGAARGPGAVPLLVSLRRRALLAAQVHGTAAAIERHLGAVSPAEREAAARTLEALLAADYLDDHDLRQAAVAALAASLAKAEPNLAARTAALEALGAAGPMTLQNALALQQLELDKARQTFAERSAVLRAIAQLRMTARHKAVLALWDQLPLDAPPDLQEAAGRALVRIDADQALTRLVRRLHLKSAADLDVQAEIGLLGELPPASAVPALLGISQLVSEHAERVRFVQACEKLADPRLIAPLARLLDPRRPDLRWHAIEALRQIDTVGAAQALRPHLAEEADLGRKLQIASFLGRHGLRDGYPYAIEHMSEPALLEPAVAALAAIRAPQTVAELRQIVETSHDTLWTGAAIRALGALGQHEFAARFLDLVRDLRDPRAPYALIALGDLREVKALDKVREALSKRNERVVSAGIRAAAKLLALPGAKADDLRDQLAALLADPEAEVQLRGAALDALLALDDPRFNRALVAVLREGSDLEDNPLLRRAEELLSDRQVRLARPQ